MISQPTLLPRQNGEHDTGAAWGEFEEHTAVVHDFETEDVRERREEFDVGHAEESDRL